MSKLFVKVSVVNLASCLLALPIRCFLISNEPCMAVRHPTKNVLYEVIRTLFGELLLAPTSRLFKNMFRFYVNFVFIATVLQYIENLDGLKNLTALNLSGNVIERLEKIDRLTNLRQLHVAHNKIA